MSETPRQSGNHDWKVRPQLLGCTCCEDEPFYRAARGRSFDLFEAECRGECGRYVRATSKYEMAEAWNALIRAGRHEVGR